MQPCTYIVLATRNGQRYLEAQYQSILAQDETHWRLLVRDDGSTDDTPRITKRLAASDGRIEILPNPEAPSGSARANFAALYSEACARGADYVLACDQDDVWLPDKLSTLLREMRDTETEAVTPSLVHHDLAVVDEGLGQIADSYWRMMRINPSDEQDPFRLLSRNEVTGCASICNRALLELALPIPSAAIMHDWWLALCAAFMGRLRFTERTLVGYRQHANNVIGARSFFSGLSPVAFASNWRDGNRELRATVSQARVFLDRFGDQLNPGSRERVTAYASLFERGRIRRIAAMRRSGAWRHNWLLDTALMMRLMTLDKQR